MKTREEHIDAIKVGDTILHNDKLVTIGIKDIKDSTFLGRTVFGDSYCLGYKLIIKVNV